MITQKIHTMEKKPYEAPEVKVVEIKLRSVITQSQCPDECNYDGVCSGVDMCEADMPRD